MRTYQYGPMGDIQITDNEAGLFSVIVANGGEMWDRLATEIERDGITVEPWAEPPTEPSQNDQLAAMGRAHAQTIRDAIAANDLRALGTATADALVAMSDILMKSQGIGVDSDQSAAGE